MKAVIPAAGLGTRMLPATKSMPKEMLPVVDQPVIQYAVEEAVASGITEILIVTGRGKRAIEDHFDRAVELEDHLRRRGDDERLRRIEAITDLADIHYVRQKQPRGLGDAVLQARTFIGDGAFAVLLGDDILSGKVPATRLLMDAHDRFGRHAVCVQEVTEQDVSRYGIIDPGEVLDDGIHRVRGMMEKPSPDVAPSRLAAMGRYVLDGDIFDRLASLDPGHGGEVQLTDALAAAAADGALSAVTFDGTRLDTGNFEGWLDANVRMALQRPDTARVVQDLIASWQESA